MAEPAVPRTQQLCVINRNPETDLASDEFLNDYTRWMADNRCPQVPKAQRLFIVNPEIKPDHHDIIDYSTQDSVSETDKLSPSEASENGSPLAYTTSSLTPQTTSAPQTTEISVSLDPIALQARLVILVAYAEMISNFLSTFSQHLYGSFPELRVVVVEFAALHMCLLNLSKAFDPSAPPYDQWLETLDLMLDMSKDPLDEIEALMKQEDRKWGMSFWNRSELASKLEGYQKRTLAYTQMLNLLFISLKPLENQQESVVEIVERILKILGGPKAQKDDLNLTATGRDMRLSDAEPIEVLGHWTPELITKQHFAANRSENVELILEKNKPEKRLFIHVVIEDEKETFIVTRNTYCERGVGNDPIIISGLEKLQAPNGTQSKTNKYLTLYVFVNSWLLRDSISLTITALEWLPAEWFPVEERSERRSWLMRKRASSS